MASATNLWQKYKDSPIYMQLIYLNVAVFLVFAFIYIGGKLLMQHGLLEFIDAFCFPASFDRWIHAPWSIITYMFVHIEPFHLLFNMLCLYWFGKFFLMHYSSVHLRGVYIMGGLFGAILYMLFYNIFPYFKDALPHSFLLGASASITALIVACAIKSPNYNVQLYLLLKIRLKYLAILMLIIDALMVVSDNAGGHIAHLGGAIFGLLFVYGISKGIDFTKWPNWIITQCSQLLSGNHFKRKPKMKIHQTTREADYDFNARRKSQQEEIDRILDKIRANGYNNLTDKEKKTLFDASKKQ